MRARILVIVLVVATLALATTAMHRVSAQPASTMFAFSSRAVSPIIDCDKDNKTITKELENAKPGDTIRFTGTCKETITITVDDLTLEGQGPAVMDGQGADQAVITIVGAHRVTIKDLTARNGHDGIRARQGAAVILEGVIAEANTTDGIQIEKDSTARIIDSTAQNNGNSGILVEWASSAGFFGNIVSNGNGSNVSVQGRSGITIRGTSNGIFHGGSMVTTSGNEVNGISVNNASSLIVARGSTVTSMDNGGNGISISGTSSLVIVRDATLQMKENDNHGIAVGSSSRFLLTEDSTLEISDNEKVGLRVGVTSSSNLVGTASITGNGSHGVEVAESSVVELRSGPTVSGNGGDGLKVRDDSYTWVVDAVIGSNSGVDVRVDSSLVKFRDSDVAGDVKLKFGAKIIGEGGNSIGAIICEDTSVLSRGDTLCP